MHNISEKLFRKKASGIAFVLCFALQLLCSALRYIYSYALGKGEVGSLTATAFEISIEFFGLLATFAGYAVIVYITFIYGEKKLGEWNLAVFAGYGLCYFLVFYIEDLNFGVVTATLLSVALAVIFMVRIKGGREISATVFLSCLLPYASGFATLFSSGAVSADIIKYNAMYGFLNLSSDFFMIIIVTMAAGIFRSRAIDKEEGGVNILIKGILPRKNPLLRSFLTVDLIYIALAASQYVANNALDIREYGWPVDLQEWGELIFPYITLIGYFAAGYLIMYLTARMLELSFVRSQEEAEAIERHF